MLRIIKKAPKEIIFAINNNEGKQYTVTLLNMGEYIGHKTRKAYETPFDIWKLAKIETDECEIDFMADSYNCPICTRIFLKDVAAMRYLGWSHVYEGLSKGIHKVDSNLIAQDYISIGELFVEDHKTFYYNNQTGTFLSDSSDECYSPEKHSNGIDLSEISAQRLYSAEKEIMNIIEVRRFLAP